MKRMRGRVVFILCSAIVVGVILANIAGIIPYETDPFNNNIINSISFIIALIAFVFAAITYFSIDSVNSITSMQGNVLENHNYTITYSTAVSQFALCSSKKEFTDRLFEIVTFNKTETCIEFADKLQKIIDNLVWFNYIDMSVTANIERLDDILIELTKEEQRYNKLSNGINYLLNENINLIKYVFEYQRHRYDKEIHICALEDVRGEMLINPVAKIIYYNYLGLDYRRQAARLIDVEDKRMPEFSVENEQNILRCIAEGLYSKEKLEKISILLKRASACFDKASKLAEDNIIWEGSIWFNIVRVNVMQFLLGQSDMTWEQIEIEYNKVIQKRGEEKYLFFDTYSDNMYLCERYKQRYQRVLIEKEAFLNMKDNALGKN